MSDFMNKATANFSSRNKRSLEVPELGMTIYARNMTLELQAKIYNTAEGDSTDYLCYAIIFGATDKDGNAIAGVGDRQNLRTNVDPKIITKVANFVLDHQGDTEEEREKN